MTQQHAGTGSQSRIRWLLIATGALVTVLLTVIGINLASNSGPTSPATTPGDWLPPPQALLSTSMQVTPKPGWRTNVSDLVATPPPEVALDPIRFATNASPFDSNPFFGNIGDRAYFVTGSPGATNPAWWLVGLDIRDGRPLFPAVRLATSGRPPDCYLNGPHSLLCIANETENVTAWTVDANSGALIFTGPTDLRTYTGRLAVRQIGIYAIAATESSGVYGVGDRAQTTWFVPGNGRISHTNPTVRELSPARAAQGSGRTSDSSIVFSPRDGVVVHPDLEDDATQARTTLYPGGFASEVVDRDGASMVRLFDESGRRVGKDIADGVLGDDSSDLPIVASPHDGWAVYSAQGEELLRQPGPAPAQTRLIGTTLFAMGNPGWHQYDLRRGATGRVCGYGLGEGSFIASDGKVAVLASGNATVGLETSGADLASCESLWTVRSPTGSFRHVWRINTTLVQLSDDGTELMSLVAPG